MILKWIRCILRPERLADYLAAQAAWNRKTVAGERVASYVMAQRDGEALLLIEWPDQPAIDRFMQSRHDELVRDHPMDGLLESFEVRYFEEVGLVDHAPDYAAMGRAAVIRHTHCFVPEENLAAFMAVQGDVWSPGMGAAPGFLGGRIWRDAAEPTGVLVITYFADAAAHAAYQAEVLPGLRERGSASLAACRAIVGTEWRQVSVCSPGGPSPALLARHPELNA